MLPAPYETNCFNYHNETKGNCFENCARNESLIHFEDRLLYGPLTVSEDRRLLSFRSFNESDYDVYLKILNKCEKICSRQNCTKTLIAPVVEAAYNYSGVSSIMVTTQPVPSIITNYVPKMNFLDYAVQVTSTFGFWMGGSLFSAYFIITESGFVTTFKSISGNYRLKRKIEARRPLRRKWSEPKRQYKFQHEIESRQMMQWVTSNERRKKIRNRMFLHHPDLISSRNITKDDNFVFRLAQLKPKTKQSKNYLTPLPPHIHQRVMGNSNKM